MIKRAVMLMLVGTGIAHAAGLADYLSGNPFLGEERKPLLMPASSSQPPLLSPSAVHAADAAREKPLENFDALRVASRTDSHALIVTATGSAGSSAGQKNWLVKNGSELFSNGRKIKVVFGPAGAIGLKAGKSDVSWLADIEPPAALRQPAPANEATTTPLSAGVGIGQKGGIAGGVGAAFASGNGAISANPAANPGANPATGQPFALQPGALR